MLFRSGGDVQCVGSLGDQPWRVAIADPRAAFGIVAMVDASDRAVATSGTSQRGDHIWLGPGREPAPRADDPASFTVVGPDISLADAYATVGFAMGEAGRAWVARHDGYHSIVVRADGTVVSDVALVSAV